MKRIPFECDLIVSQVWAVGAMVDSDTWHKITMALLGVWFFTMAVIKAWRDDGDGQ